MAIVFDVTNGHTGTGPQMLVGEETLAPEVVERLLAVPMVEAVGSTVLIEEKVCRRGGTVEHVGFGIFLAGAFGRLGCWWEPSGQVMRSESAIGLAGRRCVQVQY